MAGESNGSGTMVPIGAGIGQGVQIDGPDFPLPGGAYPHRYLHLVAGGTVGHAFLPCIGQVGRTAGHLGDKGGKHLADGALFCAESTADAWLDFFISRAVARIRRTWKGTWVELTTVSRLYSSR